MRGRPMRAQFTRNSAGCWRRWLRGWPRRRIFATKNSLHLKTACIIISISAIIGTPMPAARLRASIWQSIFTHDMRRYRRVLYRRMGDFPTLITGPSGTGKELIARAIAGARYVPFDAERMEFADAAGESFLPINIAALSPTLIESELFGHRRGSFTGAIGDRKG